MMLTRQLFMLGFAVSMTFAAEPRVSTPAVLLQPSSSPIVNFRILFTTGAASDPQSKEGVAALTSALLARGGSRALPYEQIIEAMYPLATSFDSQVDKEMTVFV